MTQRTTAQPPHSFKAPVSRDCSLHRGRFLDLKAIPSIQNWES